jgi:hypothetical protein
VIRNGAARPPPQQCRRHEARARGGKQAERGRFGYDGLRNETSAEGRAGVLAQAGPAAVGGDDATVTQGAGRIVTEDRAAAVVQVRPRPGGRAARGERGRKGDETWTRARHGLVGEP